MSTRAIFTSLACAGFILAGCARVTNVDTRAKADSIRELGRQRDAAVKARDLEKSLNFYAPDAVVYLLNR